MKNVFACVTASVNLTPSNVTYHCVRFKLLLTHYINPPATKRIDSSTVFFFSFFLVFYATAPYYYRSLYGIGEKSVLLATVSVLIKVLCEQTRELNK